MKLNRRTTLAVLTNLIIVAGATAQAQTAGYPSRPVRIVVPAPAGSGPDQVARLLALKLTEAWGGSGVVVDNKPSAGGLVAATETARAAPDGYTLLLGEVGQMSISPNTYSKLPYDPVKDFMPISQVVIADLVLLVNPQKVAARNVKDFVESVRPQNSLFMATFGAGSPGHFGAYMFGEMFKLKPEPVHYKTTAEALGGMYSGDVQAVFTSIGLAAPQVKAGKLIALASSGGGRTPALQDVPTFKEQGYPGLEFSSWFGLLAPAKTPQDIVTKINADIMKILAVPETRQKLEESGFRVTGTSRQEFARIIAADTVTWGKAVAATGFKAD